VPVQNDLTFSTLPRVLREDLCSIADLSSAEVRALLRLGHNVKHNPRDYRHALDAKQMVLMLKKLACARVLA